MDIGHFHLSAGQGLILAGASIILAAMLYGIVSDLRTGGPRTRMRRRLDAVVAADQPATESPADEMTTIRQRRRGAAAEAHTWLGRKLLGLHERLLVIGGRSGVTMFYAGPVVIAAVALVAQQVARPWDGIYVLPVAIMVGLATAKFIHRFLERRFELRFLDEFPDVLELIVRAVRAGVPVAQAMQVAGQELAEPARSEFESMADSLRLGADMGDVLKEAADRIRVADFNFFAVCVLLQRETGGTLAETLENLSRIIRARRDVRMKARALVAEGRAASKAIGAIPFACLGFLYLFSEDYVSVLFSTDIGNQLLFVAAGMLLVGFVIINRISQLEE